jgi:hypothetical protein
MSQDNDARPEIQPASSKKIDAIYSLRKAAEAKAVAEVKADANSTPENRDALLGAQLELESKTQDAIGACHECGRSHATDEPHYSDNVLTFKRPDHPLR